MKKTFYGVVLFMCAVALAVLTGCAPVSDGGSSSGGSGRSSSGGSAYYTQYAVLPPSVGTNPFAGKEYLYKGPSLVNSARIKFDNTVLTYESYDGSGTQTALIIYNYTYDTTRNKLYLSTKKIKSYSGGTNEYSSISEYMDNMDGMSYKLFGKGMNEFQKQISLNNVKYEFSCVYEHDYSFSNGKVTFDSFFPGQGRPNLSFSCSSTDSNYYINADILNCSAQGNNYTAFISWDGNGNFSGKAYRGSDPNWNSCQYLGSVSGTFTMTSGGKLAEQAGVTLTFAECPAGMPALTVGVPLKFYFQGAGLLHGEYEQQ